MKRLCSDGDNLSRLWTHFSYIDCSKETKLLPALSQNYIFFLPRWRDSYYFFSKNTLLLFLPQPSSWLTSILLFKSQRRHHFLWQSLPLQPPKPSKTRTSDQGVFLWGGLPQDSSLPSSPIYSFVIAGLLVHSPYLRVSHVAARTWSLLQPQHLAKNQNSQNYLQREI